MGCSVDNGVDKPATKAATLGPMQATVSRFEHETGDGDVLLDDGLELPFTGEALRGTGLRMLRPGQRVRIERDDMGTITRVQILTLA